MRESIYLEPVRSCHADEIQELASHPDVAATTNIPHPYPKNGAWSWIMSLTPRQAAGIEYAFAIVRGSDNAVVGVTGLTNVCKGEAELGYWIGRPFWGNGYATRASNRLIRYGFERVNLHRVYARPLLKNEASCRVLEKMGFQQDRIVPNMFPKWSEDVDLAIYELPVEQWRRRHRMRSATDRLRTTQGVARVVQIRDPGEREAARQ